MRSRRDSEAAIAIVWAIIFTVIGMGLLTLLAVSTIGEVRRTGDDMRQSRAEAWATAAAADLVHRIEIGEIGAHTGWRIPASAEGATPCGSIAPDATCLQISGKSGSGTYHVATARQLSDVSAVDFRLQGWEDGTATDNRNVKSINVRIGQTSLARYQLLSDTTMQFAAGATINGPVHANGVGVASGSVVIDASKAERTSGVPLSAANGTVLAGACASECRSNTQDVIDLSGVTRTIRTANRIAASTGGSCVGSTAYSDANQRPIVCVVPSASHPFPDGLVQGVDMYHPAWIVVIRDGSVAWRPALAAGAESTGDMTVNGSYLLDDEERPQEVGTWSSYALPTGGGTIVLPSDTFVSAPQTGGVYGPGTRGGVTIVAATPDDVTTASIFLASATQGSSSPEAPVGLVAERDVVVPAWLTLEQDGVPSGGIEARNIALVAQSGGLTMGSTGMLSGGADPCDLRALVGSPDQLTLVGSVAGRHAPRVSYGNGACTAGFANRSYAYVPTIGITPPPLYPAARPWSITDWFCTSDTSAGQCTG